MSETIYAHIQNADYQLDPCDSWTKKTANKQTDKTKQKKRKEKEKKLE